ncbi:MAG: hypothetical protein COW03_09145 [Cytophagales bacterium CG12_big_fil_rev_8_21_14_0_65_40_12]|nr:MAG: hypothetical protein COW03_09145 [Cytophagales bacterium CG12_big_fil_rev_8_21_14_0_65_40_12]PIW03563.1 MAG: hypothetical protein COW40_14290 [Cytophagales bacterium CG17_big_fil_post_rev_8_21_14_2_50_40_13]
MKVSIATGSIASIPLITQLLAGNQLDQVFISEPHKEQLSIFGQIVKPESIVKTTEIDAKNLEVSTDCQVLISAGYPYKINLLENGVEALNIHFGPLPESRGPDPLFWTLKQGKKIAYVSIHKISENFDQGELLLQKGHVIMPGENYGLLYSRLGSLLVPMVLEILSSDFKGTPQDSDNGMYYSKPTETDLRIDWNLDATKIVNLVNACNPRYHGAATTMNGTMVRVFEANPIPDNFIPNTRQLKPGQVVYAGQEGVFVKCGNDSILNLNIVSLNEGFFSGAKLAAMGVNQSITFI